MDQDPVTTIKLSAPATVLVTTSTGEHSASIDVYEATRMLRDAAKQPNELAQFQVILSWLASKLGVKKEQLAENIALDFNDMVVAVAKELNEARKKNCASIVSSLLSTQESLPTTPTGL